MKGKPPAVLHHKSLTHSKTESGLNNERQVAAKLKSVTEAPKSLFFNADMAHHIVHQPFHHNHWGEEKHLMLNLNQRLETYLSQVQLLEEENTLLTKEVQALRRSNHGASTRRKGLEEELQQARLEVDAAWRDRVHTELEVGRLTEELQVMDLQRQREAQAQVKAETVLEQSRKQLGEEQRAQIWLRGKINQLEQEKRLLLHTHQEDVACLEATLAQSRTTKPTTLVQRGNQIPNLLQLGQEYSQSSTRAWQEAAQAYEFQLAQLQESLNQSRSHLIQVGQEKSESHLKVQALEKEISSAQELRWHLEKSVAQQRDIHSHEIQQLQEHLQGLEAEKEDLHQQISHLLCENRGLLKLKMSLGLEVATYRALLDAESLKEESSFLNQPNNISITDGIFCPQGRKKIFQTQLSAQHKAASLSSVWALTGLSVISATPVCYRKPVTFEEITARGETPYPKILQDGAAENLSPPEVDDKLTCVETVSPPNEQEAHNKTSEDQEDEGDWNGVDAETERPVLESAVSYQAESGLSTEPPSCDTGTQSTASSLRPYQVRMTEDPWSLSGKDVPLEGPAEKEDMQPHAPADAGVKKEVGNVQVETSDSETEAVLKPKLESGMNSPASDCETEKSLLKQWAHFSQDENTSDAVEMRQEMSCSMVGTNETDDEDKLYPDGEEMATWNSVIERKVDLEMDDGTKKDEAKRQHAEPEEDMSPKEPEQEKREIREEFSTDVQVKDMAASVWDTQADEDVQHAALDREQVLFPDKEDDEDEDSQKGSVSWRTELESDSYAQDNTFPDPRPLIRYKSDETDVHAQALHTEESESSDGEQEKKIGEPGTGTWNEDKSKRFGTMEDLCEEVEEEALDEDYDLGYTHTEDWDEDRDSDYATSMNDAKNADEGIQRLSERQLDEESEEFTKLMVPTNVHYDEELDRLEEQELEKLCTDKYSTHFAQQQLSETEETPQDCRAAEKIIHQEEAANIKTDDTYSSSEPGLSHELTSSTTIPNQRYENPRFSESSVAKALTDIAADEEIQHEDEKVPDRAKGNKHVSMIRHVDRTDMEAISSSEDPNSTSQQNLEDVGSDTEVKGDLPVDGSSRSQENQVEGVAPWQPVPETAEVQQNQSEDSEIRDKNEQDQKCDNVPELVESHNNKGPDDTHKKEPLEISFPDIFAMKDSTELSNTNDKDGSLDDVSTSLESGESYLEARTTYKPDDGCDAPYEQSNHSPGFGVANRCRMDSGSNRALGAEEEQLHSEVKQPWSKDAADELGHAGESELECESSSFFEDPA
ncbi:nestin [Mastacembelus armatus]|uniref:nestin n=1 Tax=Mastacembelus armatus TaxID=205130 RepID=UPI000E45C835|nr:nestin-like [Mastacembelus armatus]